MFLTADSALFGAEDTCCCWRGREGEDYLNTQSCE